MNAQPRAEATVSDGDFNAFAPQASRPLNTRVSKTFSPLTPALSPLRGEGDAQRTLGLSESLSRVQTRWTRADFERSPWPRCAATVHLGSTHALCAPSPLNGERAGVRGENARGSRCHKTPCWKWLTPSERTRPDFAHPHQPDRRAFTLLELLIAVAVFSIVLAAMNAVFYGALRLRNKTTVTMEKAVPMQQALAIIKRDLANLVVPGGALSGVLQSTASSNVVTGQASPTFYTASGLIDDASPWAQVQRVSYLLAESTNRLRGQDLFRAVTRNLLPPTVEDPPSVQWLMSGVQGLAFLFHDGMQWRDSWDSTTEPNPMPQAIKVQIALAPEEKGRLLPAPIELVVPITVQARTNQTQEATGGGQ